MSQVRHFFQIYLFKIFIRRETYPYLTQKICFYQEPSICDAFEAISHRIMIFRQYLLRFTIGHMVKQSLGALLHLHWSRCKRFCPILVVDHSWFRPIGRRCVLLQAIPSFYPYTNFRPYKFYVQYNKMNSVHRHRFYWREFVENAINFWELLHYANHHNIENTRVEKKNLRRNTTKRQHFTVLSR
jgi:hypothetical protein